MVSILVLMELPYQLYRDTAVMFMLFVSILVLMELPYQLKMDRQPGSYRVGFNPCFNGIAISTVLP